jgi:3',5'-cyclic AMP phosphodiesterase CpdA
MQLSSARTVLRQLLPRALALAAALALGLSLPAAAADATRRVWVFSDCHVGLGGITNADKSVTQWLDHAVTDMQKTKLPISFVLTLGDLTHASQAEQFEQYLGLKKKAGYAPWWEIAGNHDHASIKEELWERYIKLPTRFTLADGNGIWICFSVERSGAGGKISQETLAWLRQTIQANSNKNVIVCSHQPVGHTVARSTKDHRLLYCPAPGDPEPGLYPGVEPTDPDAKREATDEAIQRVEQLVKDVRVDLWLCGHIHSSSRNKDWIVKKGNTTYINVASVNPSYGNSNGGSFVLEFQPGSKTVAARYRNHESGIFMEKNSTTVEFPFPWQPATKPTLTPAK